MENLLDHFYSSTWLMMTLFFVMLIITSIIAYGTNFFKKKIYNYIYKGIAIILPFTPLIFGLLVPVKYGFSYEIPVMCIINDKLCFLDKKEKGDDTSDWEEYRLHLLNASNGEKISRKFYEDISDIGNYKGDTILLNSYWKFILVNIKTNEPIRIINNEYLQKRFEELALGIESMDYTKNRAYDGSQSLTISITSKTAKKFYYEPFSDKLLDTSLTEHLPTLNYYFSNNDVYWKTINNKDQKIVSLEYSKGSAKIKYLKFESPAVEKSSMVSKNEYLEPKFLEVFPLQKIFIVVSYETTDKLNFILHAINFDGKELWKIKQSELNLTDRYSEEPKLHTAIRFKDRLIFNSGGFIVSLDASTGNIVWKQRV